MTDGTRTRDSQDHNLVLYQLNYGHHRFRRVTHTGCASAAWTILACPATRMPIGCYSATRSLTTAAMSLVEGPGSETNAVRR